ncbi:MAG TPA: O-antigen ligase family protein [Streptosporangiaceae bacterium]|nr:O-antigen ligase family protein [Streptosporangiaceae bacterium]
MVPIQAQGLGALPVTARAPRADAVTALSVFLFALMIIPSALVVGAFGAAGRPATLIAAALIGWYLLARPHPDMTVDAGPQPVRTAAILFACSVLASYVCANQSLLTASEQNAADRGLILLAGWLGVMLIAADGIASEHRLAALCRRIVLGATTMAVLGIAEFLTGTDLTKYVAIPGLVTHFQVTDLMTRFGLARANSTASQPLELSASLAMSLPLAIHQARHSITRLRRRRWLQVAVIAAAIPMAVSRTALIALGVMAILLVPTWPARQRRRVYVGLAGCAAGLLLIAPSFIGSFGKSFGQLGTDTSTTSRTDALSLAGPLIGAHPWFGIGLSTFNPQHAFFVDDQFVTSLIETGFIGLLALLSIFAAAWYAARRMRTARRISHRARDLAQSLVASIAVAVIFFASFDVLSFSIASSLFFLIVGVTGAAYRLSGARR